MRHLYRVLRSFRYRIYPNQKQITHLIRAMGSVRYIYNKGLETKIKAYEEAGKSPSYFNLANGLLIQEKKEHDWLKEANAQSLQATLRNLENAFTRFFRKQSKFPVFKKRSGHQSVQYPQSVKVDFNKHKIWIPKCGKVNIVIDRAFQGKIKTCTVSKTPTNKFFISILVDDGVELPPKAPIDPATSVGIDLGIKDFAILSTGEKIPNPKFFRTKLDRLKALQRRASKKQKGSQNRKKANLKVARLHEQITNQRKDFLQKTSSKIISDNQTIILEDLNIAGMLKNHKLAQAISDVSWSEFIRMLTYKAEWNGKNIIHIGRFKASSKTCSTCGALNKELTLKDREWACGSCHTKHDRDLNAATNIKKFGLIRSKEGHDLTTLPNKLTTDSDVSSLSGPERPAEPVETPRRKAGLRSRKSSSPASVGS
jgi:putative transposase